ncbi:hypothetical protein [Solimicrobium silvestre]|uniref:Uncharacterized protein n=1 Tax=Solimicrobium silvestre TaxID=2099400 RepID=A0A2S9GWM7_9BURK|nr:hypothetical protein [Solimicrobium silvestre]PRC92101.1 hypothetical protein S2091_3236 [Solimicrobium silvestre]
MYTLKRPADVAKALDIGTLKDMWNAAIAYQNQGVYDTDAMYSIYQAMNPKLTIQDIGNVFSGVYADTYWNTTFLDASLLAKSLVQAIGLDRSLATTYANNAIAQWRGILSRKNISDTGSIPVVGNYTASLDIVCNQNTPIDPMALISNWNNEYWQQPSVGKNFIYSRCQNIAFNGAITKPQVQMFYSSGGFNQPPSSWIQCFTVKDNNPIGTVITQDGKTSPLNWGDRGCSEAFYFNPTSQDHVCVISATVSEFFASNNPKQIPPGNWNSATWITHNGAAAWHNVDPQRSVEDTLAFHNQDGTNENFTFYAQCRKVPVGSKITLRSEDPNAKFTTGTVNIDNPSQLVQLQVNLPAYHKGQLKVKLEGPDGRCLPVTAAVEVKMAWRLSHSHDYYADAVATFGNTNQHNANREIQLDMGTFTILGSGK